MDNLTFIKIVSALLYPAGLIVLFALFRVVFSMIAWNGWRRFCSFAVVMIALLASNAQVATWLAGSLEAQYPQQRLEDIARHDAIVVLGGGLRIPSLPAQHVQLGRGSDRYWYAAQLFQAGKADRILLAGGNVYAQASLKGEAFYARQLLIDWGVPPDAIVFEQRSRNTWQNQQQIASLVREGNIKSVLLVTSALHMPRALRIFRQLPIPVTPASADVLVRQETRPPIFNWIPSASAFYLTTLSLHEYYGLWFAQISNVWKDLRASL